MELETATATIISLALVALLLLIANRLSKSSNKHKHHPPQPPSWPVIGHLHLFKKKIPIHRILSSLSQRYGGIMHLQLGCRPLLVISSSHLAKECLTTNDKTFASRPRFFSAGEHLGYGYKMFFLAPYSNYWRNLRRLCTLGLFSAHIITSSKHVRQEEVSALIRSLFESCQQQPNATTVNMKSRRNELAFSIIARMVCGQTVFGSARSDNSQRAAHVKEMRDEHLHLVGVFNVGDYLPFLKWLHLQGLEAAMKNLHKKRDDFMQKLVDQHREKRRIQTEEEDLIDVLLSATENHEILSDDEDNNTVVKANALNMIDAGTDSSADTVEWALAALLQNPHILGKAQQELDTRIGRERVIEESDLHKLKYLEAIVKETLRLYPPGPLLITHESTEDCTVGGYHVKAGTQLIVNAWAIHRDPALWECPLEFDPDRFLNNEIEIDVKGHNFELIPFGSGRRMCPGMPLALCVVSYTLARLLQSFDWSLPPGSKIEMEEGFGVAMPKAVPLQAVISPRLPLHLYS